MIACFDVFYRDSGATAAAITFADWQSESSSSQIQLEIAKVPDYEPGLFFRRELPPLTAVVQKLQTPVKIYIVDAYCHLNANLDSGLGSYFHETLPNDSVVIGVAKNRFRDTTHAVELLRGKSKRPLFITSIGMEYDEAARHIESMAGEHRFPKLLKEVDKLSRANTS